VDRNWLKNARAEESHRVIVLVLKILGQTLGRQDCNMRLKIHPRTTMKLHAVHDVDNVQDRRDSRSGLV
jgi:hypothetical protein